MTEAKKKEGLTAAGGESACWKFGSGGRLPSPHHKIPKLYRMPMKSRPSAEGVIGDAPPAVEL